MKGLSHFVRKVAHKAGFSRSSATTIAGIMGDPRALQRSKHLRHATKALGVFGTQSATPSMQSGSLVSKLLKKYNAAITNYANKQVARTAASAKTSDAAYVRQSASSKHLDYKYRKLSEIL